MAVTIKDRLQSLDILKEYNGDNPYIHMLKRDVILKGGEINDFGVEYVIKNHDYKPVMINKTVKLADWYQKKKQEDWNLEFLPEKISIKWLLGETSTTYHCYAKYRQSVDPVQVFLPKKAVLTNFLVSDYKQVNVDFERYDKLSMSKDSKRKLREHQKEAVQFLLSRKKCILADDMGYGKLEPVSSLIPTPNGFKRMGDIVKGDTVFDMHGKPVEVLNTFPHKNKDIYEVTLNDGTKVRCGLEHLWYVRNKNWKDKRWEVLSLEEIMKIGLRDKISENTRKKCGSKIRNKWLIPTIQPVEYEEKKFLIHPYLLGICIGDGNLCNSGIDISIPDFEIETVERISKLLTEGYELKVKYGTCPIYSIIKEKNNISIKNIYNREIKRLGLNVHGNLKFIPEEYKIASIEQRKELLMGLMDSDGCITKTGNKIFYSTNSKQLAEDVCELVFSLGGVAKVRQYKRKKNNKETIEYQVPIQITFCPFKIERKKQRYNPTFKKYCNRYIQSVELIGKEDAQCIYVDSPEHTYATGKHYVVTHNTTSLSVAAIEGNFDSVLIICPASIKSTWKKELLWYVPERDITIVEGIQGKTKNELEKYLGYGEGKSGKKVSELKEEAKERGKWQDNRFVIVNFDILDEVYKIPATRSKENIEKALQESPMLQYLLNKKSLIIIDEAHKLSDMTSIRYKVIKDLVKRAQPDSIYAATGTPITNNPLNFYCVLQFLGDPITDDYFYYMERYCDARKFPKNPQEKEKRNRISENFIKSKNKVNWYQLTNDEKNELNRIIDTNVKMITVPNGASNLEELKERVSHIYLRRMKEDLKDVVKKTVHELYYDLTPQQLEQYNRLWDEYETAQYELDPTKELNRNLLEGAIYRRYLSNEMIPFTIKLVDSFIENNEKVVVGCCYDEELYRLRDYYGDKCVVYNGKMNSKEKDAAQEAFMTNPDVKVFIGNLLSAGVGLTLTAAKKLVFNDFSFVKGDNDQFQDRIHRLNQTEDVDIYFQIFKDTQYQKMWEIVMRKGYIIDQIIKKESEK